MPAYPSTASQRDLGFELERAITENELVLHYQPRILMATRQLRGFEALVRWRHPVYGIIPPSEFLAAAERAGLLRDLQAWVIREALLQAAVWRGDGIKAGVSVNVTPSLLRDGSFLRLFERTLRIRGEPTTFTFEVALGEPPRRGASGRGPRAIAKGGCPARPL